MPFQFQNNIKGTTAGTPGTGAFTPNAASTGFQAWSTVFTGWYGLVRYEDGSSWELSYGYWNGTTISRPANGFVSSSSGSQLSLTSAATAALVIDGDTVSPIIGFSSTRFAIGGVGASTFSSIGMGTVTATGTAAASTIATTNFLTEQQRIQSASATTANAQSGWTAASALTVVSSSAGHGGFRFCSKFGASSVPTGPRMFLGLTASTFVANTGEPSAFTANYAVFGKDSTDTNIQLLVNSNVSTGTKTDTGIPLTANGWYDGCIWQDAGSTAVEALLVRADTGDIWYGTTSTDVPANGSLLFPQLLGGLNGTNTGTAFTLNVGQFSLRTGL